MVKALIFIDKSGVDLAMSYLQTRLAKGKRAYCCLRTSLSPVHLALKVSLPTIDGWVGSLTFEAFVGQKLLLKLWKGVCIVVDNCAIHLGQTIRELLEAAGYSSSTCLPTRLTSRPSKTAGLGSRASSEPLGQESTPA